MNATRSITAAEMLADVTGRLSEQLGGAGTPIPIVRAGTSLYGEGAFKSGIIAGLALHGSGAALPVRRVLPEVRRAVLVFA